MKRWSIAIVLALCACSQPFSQGGKKPIDLRLNLKSGDKYISTTDFDQVMKQTMAGNEMTMTSKMEMIMGFDVKNTDASGNYNITQTFRKIKADIAAGPMTINFDSDDTSKADPKTAIFRKIVGSQIDVKLSPKAKVLEINGMKELMERAMQSISPEDSAANAQTMTMMKGLWSEEGIRQMMEQGLGYLPPNSVKPGDTWNSEFTGNAVVPLKFQNQYTLKERKGGQSILDAKSSFAIDTVMTMDMGQPMPMTMTMSGNGVGLMMIDEKTGMLKNGNMTINLSGNMSINTPMTGEMKIPITGTMTSTTKFEKQ